MAKRLFQQSLSDHCVGRSLSFGKVVAYRPRGSLSHKRICLLYSVVKQGRAGKRGTLNHALLKTAYSSSISKAISNPKIILISASRISPFNSISTTI